MLERSEWYDIARDTNWTPSYVSQEALFPPEMGDPYGIPTEEWETFDEPYKVSYREYVSIQREKDSAAYSVKAALARSKFHDEADEGWACVLKLHYGAVALTEYQALPVPGADVPLRPVARDAQHVGLRHARRAAAHPAAALLPARAGPPRPPVRLGARGPALQELGGFGRPSRHGRHHDDAGRHHVVSDGLLRLRDRARPTCR